LQFISDGDLILGVNKKYWSLAFLHKHLEDIAAVLCQVTFTHEQLKARNAAKGDVNKIESLPHQIRHAVMCKNDGFSTFLILLVQLGITFNY